MIVACLGDSITAGSPLWDPDPLVRAEIDEPDVRSQWHWWASQRDPAVEFRNHGAYGERTDEIAARLDGALDGVDAIVLQGGINDIAQGRPIETAAQNLVGMARRARARGVRAALTDVLPWNNGDERAAEEIVRLNALLVSVSCGLVIPLLRFHDALADPNDPQRMAAAWTDDGDHPSVDGHRRLGELAFRPF